MEEIIRPASYTLVRIKWISICRVLCLEQNLTLDKHSVNAAVIIYPLFIYASSHPLIYSRKDRRYLVSIEFYVVKTISFLPHPQGMTVPWSRQETWFYRDNRHPLCHPPQCLVLGCFVSDGVLSHRVALSAGGTNDPNTPLGDLSRGSCVLPKPLSGVSVTPLRLWPSTAEERREGKISSLLAHLPNLWDRLFSSSFPPASTQEQWWWGWRGRGTRGAWYTWLKAKTALSLGRDSYPGKQMVTWGRTQPYRPRRISAAGALGKASFLSPVLLSPVPNASVTMRVTLNIDWAPVVASKYKVAKKNHLTAVQAKAREVEDPAQELTALQGQILGSGEVSGSGLLFPQKQLPFQLLLNTNSKLFPTSLIEESKPKMIIFTTTLPHIFVPFSNKKYIYNNTGQQPFCICSLKMLWTATKQPICLWFQAKTHWVCFFTSERREFTSRRDAYGGLPASALPGAARPSWSSWTAGATVLMLRGWMNPPLSQQVTTSSSP